jgi:hypothetical protein
MNGDDDRRTNDLEEARAREAGLDDTIAQTFPASDPASSIPNPREPELLDEATGDESDSGDPR